MELEFIAWLREHVGNHSSLPLGLNDDAAVLQLASAGDVVLTSDLLTDGVDFQLSACTPQQVGRKALAVNLSDLAAMAAKPVAALVSIALPRKDAPALARGIYEGLLPLAKQFQLPLAGGDTNTWTGALVISVTLVGQVTERGPLTRRGANAGDQLLVTGDLGGSILQRHFSFEPRVREAMLLNERYRLNAGLDISDGLTLDASRLATASGCGILLDLSQIPISADAHRLAELRQGQSALDHALTDGEDFELLLAVSSSEADRLLDDQPLDVPLTRIGCFIPEVGLWRTEEDGSRSPLIPRGYEH